MIKRNTLLTAVLILTVFNAYTQTYFGSQQVITTSVSELRSIHSSDIDGDGDLDILSASSRDDKIAWYENSNGLGTFDVEHVITITADYVVCVHSGDIDGDGDMDVLSKSDEGVGIAWYENTDGAGNFDTMRIVADGASPDEIYSCDMDGDGDQDILASYYRSPGNKIAWFENLDGLGDFGTEQVISVTSTSSIFACDFDSDGDQDVLYSTYSDDKIAWFENLDGNGTFDTEQIISNVIVGPLSVHAVDVDGDGDNDVLSTSKHNILWFEYLESTETFDTAKVITTIAYSVNSVSACDFDGDGDQDVFSADQSGDRIAWYENRDGAGTFSSQNVITNDADGAISAHSFDIDGDGDQDIISASMYDNKIAWYENKSNDYGFSSNQQIISLTADGAAYVHAADIDGDGDQDVLSASYYDDKIAWYENLDGNGTFDTVDVISSTADGARTVYTGDIDGDGDLDVLSASFRGDKIAWHENADGLGTFNSEQIISNTAQGAFSVFVVDIDGDNDQDVLSASWDDDKIAWYENLDGNGTFDTVQVITSTADGAQKVYAGDIDGDGDQDVLSASYLDNKIAWYENLDGKGTFDTTKVISTEMNGARSVFACDLDGDGDLDVISASYNDDKIAWYENTDGAGTFGPQQVVTTLADEAWSVYASDIDGDGDLDIFSSSTRNYNNKVAWYENKDGKGTFGSLLLITSTVNGPTSVFSCDIDGDGDQDILSSSSGDDKIAWYKNLKLEILTQPKDSAVSCGANASFTIKVKDAENYFWQIDTSGVFSNLTNDGTYSGVDSDTLHITNATSAISSSQYRCVVSYVAGTETSDTVSLIVGDFEKPVISSIHLDQVIEANANCEATMPNYLTGVVAGDDCDATLDIAQSPLAGTTISGATNVVTITATDDLGNADTVLFNVQVVDSSAPGISSAHPDITVDANENCQAVLLDYTGDVVTIDNCDLSLDITQQPVAGTIISGLTNEVTITITDDTGNKTDITFNVAVIDNSGPIITSTHSDQMVTAAACEATLADYEVDVIATDNCDLSLDITQSPVAGTTISGVTNEVTLAVKDDAGNTTVVTFNVAVIDTVDPVITSVHNDQFLDAGAGCITALPDYIGGVIATDDCDSSLDIIQSPVAGTAMSGATNEVVLTVSDDAGNKAIASFNVEIADNTAPEITSTHSEQTINADANCEAPLPNYIGDVIASDNCDVDLDIIQSPIAGSILTGTTNEITITVADKTGNTSEVKFNIAVVDNTAPIVMSEHTDQTYAANANCETALPDYTGAVIAIDNCDLVLDITQSPVAGTLLTGATNEVTLAIEDDMENIVEVKFNVAVVDNVNPIITSTHNDQTLNANALCIAALPDYTGDVIATDNCDTALTITQSPFAGTAMTGSVNQVTLTVRDDVGNSSQITFNVTVVDNSDPIVTSTHVDQVIDANASLEAILPDYTADLIVSDNCDSDLSIIQNPIGGTSISGAINEVTLTVIDDAGNSTVITFNVEVADISSPVITSTHNDIIVSDVGNCEATLLDYTGDVIASDICDPNLTITQNPLSGTSITGIINEVTLTVTDDAGNSADAKFNVAVEDKTNPVISSSHSDVTVDANTSCEVSLANYTGDLMATDECDAELDITQLPEAGTLISGSTNKITLTAMDDAGNSDKISFNVAVVDNENPTITCVENQTFNLTSERLSYTVSGTELNPLSTTDNCGVASVINNFNNSLTLDGTEFPIGTTSVVWTVKDEADNSAYCSFDVIINKASGTRERAGEEISIYPNPTSGIVYFEEIKEEIQSVTVFDMTGKLILNESNMKYKNIDLSSLESGVYRISIKTNTESFIKPVVKE